MAKKKDNKKTVEAEETKDTQATKAEQASKAASTTTQKKTSQSDSSSKTDSPSKDVVVMPDDSDYSGKSIIEVNGVDKYFKVGEQDVHVLKNIDLKIHSGDFVIIFGASGSGKSTLLHILLGLEPPSNGQTLFLGNDLYEGTDEDYRAEVRKKHIGMVYQQANWVKSLSVAENIAFPLQLLGMEKSQAIQRAHEVLAKFELENWADYFPTELSSGQQQRISMARAIVHNPMMIVADEPTGNLDYENGVKVMELLQGLNKNDDKTVIMVTHDLDYLAYAKTAVQIFDGEVVGVFRGKDKSKIEKEIKKRKQYSEASESNKTNNSKKKGPEKDRGGDTGSIDGKAKRNMPQASEVKDAQKQDGASESESSVNKISEQSGNPVEKTSEKSQSQEQSNGTQKKSRLSKLVDKVIRRDT